MRVRCFGVLVLFHAALANVTTTNNHTSTISVANSTKNEIINVTKTIQPNNEINTTKLKISRRKNKKSRSTSSSSGERVVKKDDASSARSSLEILSSDDSSNEEKNETYGIGWRRWHRKCTPCPVEMGKRWREPTIGWICGGFQRARRSFKSECMMHYRNCQDGTMFVKIHSRRCSDTQPGNFKRGLHWFYDYKVKLSDDSTDSDTDSESSDMKSSAESDSLDSLSLGK